MKLGEWLDAKPTLQAVRDGISGEKALAIVLHPAVPRCLALRPLETRTAAPAEARGGPGRPRCEDAIARAAKEVRCGDADRRSAEDHESASCAERVPEEGAVVRKCRCAGVN